MRISLKELKSNIFQLILFAIACLLLVSFIAFLMSNGKSFDIGKLGSLGDFFGGILNPIFSFLAFLALLTTIILQASELKATRKELRKSARAQKKQSKSLKLQNFENTFFNLINLHNDLTTKFREFNIIENDENGEKYYMYGDEAISFFLDKFKGTCSYSDVKNEDRHLDIDSLRINFEIKKVRHSFKFIRTVYTILNLMESYKNIKNNENKIKYYLDILYAQISEEELILIFYYGLLYKSYFKELLEEYGFFEDIKIDKLLNKKELLLYNISAYGDNELIKSIYYQNKS